jgi:hypothetical protein
MGKSVPEMLRECADLYEQRNALYGDNYRRFGYFMARLFPAGVRVETPDDWNRIGIFVQVAAKLSRYANQWEHGHRDSLDDMAVYAMMLRELDDEIADEAK